MTDLQRNDADCESHSLAELIGPVQAWIALRPHRWMKRNPNDVPEEIKRVYEQRGLHIVRARSKGEWAWKIQSSTGKTVEWKRQNSVKTPWAVSI